MSLTDIIHDYGNIKFGKKGAKVDPFTFRFADILRPALPTPPTMLDNGVNVKDWGMLLNDKLGDCTCAGILHMIMLWTSITHAVPAKFTDDDAQKLYQLLCGYVPGDPQTDQGGVELDILKAWRHTQIYGHKIDYYAIVDAKNWDHVKLASYLCGSLYMGLLLPDTIQHEAVWSTTKSRNYLGGHCVVSSGYHDLGGDQRLKCVTWGKDNQWMTRKWLATYCDELYAPISLDWFARGVTPQGFDLKKLESYVAAL